MEFDSFYLNLLCLHLPRATPGVDRHNQVQAIREKGEKTTWSFRIYRTLSKHVGIDYVSLAIMHYAASKMYFHGINCYASFVL